MFFRRISLATQNPTPHKDENSYKEIMRSYRGGAPPLFASTRIVRASCILCSIMVAYLPSKGADCQCYRWTIRPHVGPQIILPRADAARPARYLNCAQVFSNSRKRASLSEEPRGFAGSTDNRGRRRVWHRYSGGISAPTTLANLQVWTGRSGEHGPQPK